jgi:glycerol kinase
LFAGGAPDPGTLFVNIGTGAFVQRPVGGALPDAPGLLQSVVWQDGRRSVNVLEGTVNGAGAALEWLAGERGMRVASLVERAEDWLGESEDPPLFINGVGGLGAPYWVADCPMRFDRDGSLAEQTAAVLESIVFLLQVNIEAICEASGGRHGDPQRIIASGGIARVDGVCRRLADLSGLPVERSADIEATARGLARLLSGTATSEQPAPTRFRPRPNTGLQSRFAAWRAALEASVADL